jgi:sec-independent protein translocase protein TatC
VAIGGVLAAFGGKPAQPIGPGGQMSLGDHFRELRARILKATLALVVMTIASFFIYNQLLDLITHPYNDAIKALGGPKKAHSTLVVNGVGGGLSLQIKLCAISGVVLSSPIWLYQIWAFLVPGLRRNERRWTLLFVLIAGPLFAAGVALGYYVLPKGIQVLISFNPDNVENLNDFGDFFTFIAQMLLVFGVALEIPFFVILLNLAGVVSGKALARYRPWIILGTFVFAAVATPSTDPFSMLLLAFPMLGLFMFSEVLARLVDRRRRKAASTVETWDDDAPSPL